VSATRVLFLSDHLGYPGGVVHGVTTYFLQVLPRLAQREVALTVCFFRHRHSAARRLQAAGVDPIFLSHPRWDMRALPNLIRLIRKHRTEVVHASGVKGILMARLAARQTGARCVIHVHDTSHLPAPIRWVQRATASWTDLTLAVSQPVAELAKRNYGVDGQQMRLLHYAVDLTAYAGERPETRHRVRRELGIAPQAPVVGMLGRFHPMKGHPTALRMMQRVRESVPGAVLLLAGDGPERPRCEALARELGLGESVVFAGQRDDVPAVLQAVDVLVMPSQAREGLPYSGIEALAAGRPIVAYDVGGLGELVLEERTGRLIEPGDADQLTASVVELLSQPGILRRLSDGARQHARQFELDRHVETLVQLYQQLSATGEAGSMVEPTAETGPRHRQSRYSSTSASRFLSVF